jgi:glycosyltransferase involved in cell wall biosynthesis
MAGKGSDTVLFLVPGDPHQRTGGYRYVAQLVKALEQNGFDARVQGLEGRFPIPDSVAESAMDSALSHCEEGTCIVLDGLAMGGLPSVVEKHAGRLHLVALVHHPLADETGISDDDKAFLFASETRALAAVSGVITTSHHTAERLKDFQVSQDVIQVIEPGANTVSAITESPRQVSETGEIQLLCVASLSPRKAQHQLVQALAELQHLSWHCCLVGSTERDPQYSQQVIDQIEELALAGRISLAGELDDEPLGQKYIDADLFVLPSLYEGYGMVIDEALAAGLPIITSDGGALASTGNRPGIRQYPAGSIDGLKQCLQSCLTDRPLLQQMAVAARKSSETIRQWSDAAREFEQALERNIETRDHSQFDQHWLTLREPADHQARNGDLVRRVQDWAGPGELRIVDLGAGAGSNGACLSEALTQEQHWTLLDQDASLLAEARSRLAPKVARLETRQCSLDIGKLNELMPDHTQLITASALIDLMSAPWLDALAEAAAAHHAAVYIVLSYAGHFQLGPDHPDDDWMRSLVNDHQHGDKGSGAALGPEATDYLKDQLEGWGFEVAVAPSPWMLSGDERLLQAALIAGWCEAALEQSPAESARIETWKASRLAMAEQGELTVQVDHHDLFAWPTDD